MVDRIDLLVSTVAERHHGVFGTHHLAELGVEVHERNYRLAIDRWILIHDGVYRFAGTPLSWHGRVLAACWAGGVRAVASHRTAAELWELPGRTREIVELTCPHWRRARHAGLVVHESRVLEDEDRASAGGIPATSVARTLFDLAGVRQRATVDLAIDNALRRSLVTTSELEAVLARLGKRGREGTKPFRTLLAERVTTTESDGERRLLQLLERQGLPRPVPQFELRDDDGRLVARVDFAYPDLKIAIEYDSYAHHVGKDALDRDGARRNAVVALGWLPITATAADLRDHGRRLAIDVRRARALRSGVDATE